jgi:hypothetical protein
VPRAKKATVSKRLQAELASRKPGDPVDIIIALAPPDLPAANLATHGDRAQAIDSVKKAFEVNAQSVTADLSALGGEVVDSAWINSTLRGRVAVDQVKHLAKSRGVEALDLPSELTPEVDD